MMLAKRKSPLLLIMQRSDQEETSATGVHCHFQGSKDKYVRRTTT
jgi:hypothetical protein